jgi:hypothetical protein
MFGREKRKRRERHRQTTSRVQALQRGVYSQLNPLFVARYGQIDGSRLTQEVVDKLFGRVTPRSVHDLALAEESAGEVAKENQNVRDAAFVSLRAMLEVEGANKNFTAERRILDTIHWLKQFGEIPSDASEPQALNRISETLFTNRGQRLMHRTH